MADPHSLYLDQKKLDGIIDLLSQRIGERFSDSDLLQVCRDLQAICQRAGQKDIAAISKPNWRLRIGVLAFIIAVAATVGVALVYSLSMLQIEFTGSNVFDFIQAVESALNGLFLVGAATLLLVSLENRSKRHCVIQRINELRAIAHLVDMLQLTEDPPILHSGAPTDHSPTRQLNHFQLGRYLVYCSEMLSLVGKVGFLYVQGYHDPEATNAVNDLEDLTTGLSQKIWQKILVHESTTHGIPNPRA